MSTPTEQHRDEFPATRWSLVVAAANTASPEVAGDALAQLCTSYWYPLYAYARRRGLSPHDAEDRTQAFFESLLARGSFAAADQEKGRLRTFLLGAMKNFLAQEWRRDHALKRGGAHTTISIDAARAEQRFADEPADGRSPDTLFDQSWAYTLLETVLERLRESYAGRGSAELFDALRGHLTASHAAIPHAQVAARFGMTEGAVRAALFQLRKRYKQTLHAEVLETVAAEDDARQELLHLRQILAAAS